MLADTTARQSGWFVRSGQLPADELFKLARKSCSGQVCGAARPEGGRVRPVRRVGGLRAVAFCNGPALLPTGFQAPEVAQNTFSEICRRRHGPSRRGEPPAGAARGKRARTADTVNGGSPVAPSAPQAEQIVFENILPTVSVVSGCSLAALEQCPAAAARPDSTISEPAQPPPRVPAALPEALSASSSVPDAATAASEQRLEVAEHLGLVTSYVTELCGCAHNVGPGRE